MQDLNDLYYFVKSVDHGSFAAAGRALGLPRSKLSRRVAELEKRLNMRLIQRSTRQFKLTEPGQIYYQHCKAMLVEAEAAQEAMDALREEPCGLIRVACPVALLHLHIAPMASEFMRKYPKVTVQIKALNRAVDLVEEGYDVALRVRPLPLRDSQLISRSLGNREQLLVASPQLLEQYQTVKAPADLSVLPFLFHGSAQEQYLLSLAGENQAKAQLHLEPRLISDDLQTLHQAALEGLGVSKLPKSLVRQDLQAGRLIKLLADWSLASEMIHLVFPSRRGLLPSVRAFIDHLVANFEQLPDD